MIVWAREIGANSIYFKSLSMGSHTTKEIKDKWSFLLPEEDKYKRKQFNFDYPICNIPRNQSVVYWNGNLGLCCIDYSNDIKISNIKKDGYVNTLFSKDTIKKRKKVLKNNTVYVWIVLLEMQIIWEKLINLTILIMKLLTAQRKVC